MRVDLTNRWTSWISLQTSGDIRASGSKGSFLTVAAQEFWSVSDIKQMSEMCQKSPYGAPTINDGSADKKTEVDRSGCSNRDAAHFAILRHTLDAVAGLSEIQNNPQTEPTEPAEGMKGCYHLYPRQIRSAQRFCRPRGSPPCTGAPPRYRPA